MRVRLVLQRALAALVAHRTVERVVGEEGSSTPLLGPLDAGRGGADDLTLGDRRHAADDHHRAARTFDFDEALAAHADRPHARVVAEARHVGAGQLAGVDDEPVGFAS